MLRTTRLRADLCVSTLNIIGRAVFAVGLMVRIYISKYHYGLGDMGVNYRTRRARVWLTSVLFRGAMDHTVD